MTWTRRKFIKTGLISTAVLLFADAFFYEKHFIETREFNLGKASDTDKDFRIIQVSDLHLHALTSELKKLAETINGLKPDLIVFTGDSVDDSKKLYVLNSFLELLNPDIPKLAILGNWEYWGNVVIEDIRSIYSRYNCGLLVNESRQLKLGGKTISITGVDDYVGGNADFDKAVSNHIKSDYHIVLNHCPQYSETIAQRAEGIHSIDLILSGHTHGGQVNLFGFVAFLPQGSGKFLKGWYKEKSTPIYVSKGIGTSILPVRFMSRAEIAVFNLKK